MLFRPFIVCCTIKIIISFRKDNNVVHCSFIITNQNDDLSFVQWTNSNNNNNNNKNPTLLSISASTRPRLLIGQDTQKRTIHSQQHMLLHMLQQQQHLTGERIGYYDVSRHSDKYRWKIQRPTITRSILSKPTSLSKATSTTALSLSSVSSILSTVIFPLQSIISNIQLPLISKNDYWGNWCIIIVSACISQIIGNTTKIGQLLGTPVTAMVLTFIMASINIIQCGGTIPTQQLQLLSLQLSTPFILLGANFSKSVLQQCGPLLISFLFASIATIVGCSIGWYCVGSILMTSAFPLSSNVYDGLIIASALLAKNIGGGINYIAICTTFHASTNAIAAGLCIDNIFALLYFPLSSIIASYFPDIIITSTTTTTTGSTDPNSNTSITGPDSAVETVCADDGINTALTTKQAVAPTPGTITTTTALDSTTTKNDSDKNFTVHNILNVLCISVTLLWISQLLVGGSNNAGAALPVCTILSVIVSTFILPKNFIEPLRTVSNTFGLLTLYIFFATAGSSGIAIASSVRTSILPLSIFLFCLYSIHTIILYSLYIVFHKVLFRNGVIPIPASLTLTSTSTFSTRTNNMLRQLVYKIKLLLYESVVPQRLLVASSAAIGGPATALALTKTVNWTSFEVPCIVIGNIGYTIATFCGYLFYNHFYIPL